MIAIVDTPIKQCPYFPRGREATTIFHETGGLTTVSIPYVYVVDGKGKGIKLYDFDNASHALPEFAKLRMVMSQLRLVNAKLDVYADLLAKFIQHTQTNTKAA